MLQRLVGGQPGAIGEQFGQCVRQPLSELGGRRAIATPDVGVRQRGLTWQSMAGPRQGIAKIAEQQMVRIRSIGRMGANFPLEHEDLTCRQKLTQMIVGATVAQAELEHGPWQIGNPSDREIEAGTLGLKPTDETVETTHAASFWQMTKLLADDQRLPSPVQASTIARDKVDRQTCTDPDACAQHRP
jgi:hypothetical protein